MISLQKIFRRQDVQGLGTVSGVLIPNILQMVGVILYMRLGWITGHVGLPMMVMIISFSSTILLLTGLSMTSIITNMRMGGGGSYYLISRSLGIELGTALGILLAVSQMTSIALCVSGFSATLQPWFPGVPSSYVELITIAFLTLISYVSTNLAVKAQMIIFLVLGASVWAVFSGSASNIPADFAPIPTLESLTFWAAFAMFFPATTGIEAGMSVSGELRNPTRSLPIGTIGSILVAYLLYTSLACFLSSQVSRDLLISYPMIATNLAKIGFLVILGIWGATLSSALGGIIGAPRTLQAISKDGMLPKFLAKGVGASELPRMAILCVFLFSSLLTAFTSINQLIPFQTMICLMTYALVNFIAFFETVIQNPSWRPAIKTPWFISLLGTVLCVVSMFMFNPGASFIVLALLCLLTLWAGKKRIKGNWEDIRFALFSFVVRASTHQLIKVENNPKSWRPHLLTLVDPEFSYESMIHFSDSLNQAKGFLTFGAVLSDPAASSRLKGKIRDYLQSHQISGFYRVNQDAQPITGFTHMVESYGLGPLKPNTVLLPTQFFLQNPQECAQLILSSYRQEKNLLLFNHHLCDTTLFKKATKEQKVIHLWWGGGYRGNFELSLALSHQIQQSEEWAGAALNIHVLVPNENGEKEMASKYDLYKSKLRLRNLSFCPVIDENRDFYKALHQSAHRDGLTFLGLRIPREDEQAAEYGQYLQEVLQKTSDIHNLVFVLAGEPMDFRKLFQ